MDDWTSVRVRGLIQPVSPMSLLSVTGLTRIVCYSANFVFTAIENDDAYPLSCDLSAVK